MIKRKHVLWLSVVLVLAAFAGGCAKTPLPLPPDVASAGGESAADGGRDASLKDSGLRGPGSGGQRDAADGSLKDSGRSMNSLKEENLGGGSSDKSAGGGKGEMADLGSSAQAGAGKNGGTVPGKEGMTDFGAPGQGSMGGAAGSAGGDSVARMLPFEPTSDLQDVFFKFDKYDLDETSKDALKKNASWLKEHANVRVEIQGHCDERGTNNYNLGLGERRALSVKKYLMALGLDKDRLFTISYGEERPFCRESNENCWAQNRRAHFLVAR